MRGSALLLATAAAACGGTGGSPGSDATRACLPAPVGDPIGASAGGAWLYRTCDGDGIVIELPGADPLVAAGDVRLVKDRHDAAEYLAVDGVVGVGVRRCCQTDGEGYCIHLDVQTHTIALDDLVRQVETWFPPGERCLGVVVNWIGLLEPRCAAADPGCVPIAYCPDTGGDCCPSAVVYDPARGRQALTGPEVDGLSAGACTQDGECFTNGCGQLCHAYTVPGEITTCECQLALQPALCGCVEGRCAWFEPAP